MKKIASLIVVLSLLSNVCLFAYDEERNKGITALKSKQQRVLQEIDQKEPVSPYGDTMVRTLSQIKATIDSKYYNTAAESDYTKAKVMEMLSQLAITSAFAVGTAAQPEQLALVKQQATELLASSDPQMQQLGQKYSDLAQAIEKGDSIQAQAIAGEIKEYVTQNEPSISPGYAPSAKENTFLAGLGSVLSNSLMKVGSLLTTFGVQGLLTLLGGAALASSPLGIAVSILMSDTIGAVANGIMNNGQINWDQTGSSGANVAGVGANSGTMQLEKALGEANAKITPIAWPTQAPNIPAQGSNSESAAPKTIQ